MSNCDDDLVIRYTPTACRKDSRDVVHEGCQRLYGVRADVVELGNELFRGLQCLCQSIGLPPETATHLVSNCRSGKRQRFIGQEVSVVCRGQLQTEVYDRVEHMLTIDKGVRMPENEIYLPDSRTASSWCTAPV